MRPFYTRVIDTTTTLRRISVVQPADGAELNEQALYAITSAALSYGIEQFCNVAFSGLKAVVPGIADDVLTEGIEKLALKLTSTPEGAELFIKLGKAAVSGVSEGGEEFVEAALQPFLQKMIYNSDTKTILDDPNLLSDYLYEGLIGGTLGVLGNGVNVNTGTEVDTDIEAETGQSKKSTLPVLETMDPSELDWDARELFSLDGDSAEINADSMIESSTDTDSTELDDFDPWAMFSVDEDAEASNSDYVTDSRTMNERSRHFRINESDLLREDHFPVKRCSI